MEGWDWWKPLEHSELENNVTSLVPRWSWVQVVCGSEGTVPGCESILNQEKVLGQQGT